MIIAIDGPVASGKSSIGKRLADQLGYLFFDTGVLYRAITFLALRDLGSAQDRAAVIQLTERAQLDVHPPLIADGRDCTVLAGPEQADITWAIRAKEVESNVSLVAALPEVRRTLTAQMRQIGLRGNIVMVGRDIGTVVLPEADCKIFLTATVEERAQRRFLESQTRGDARSYAEILENLRERDRIDSSRQLAPLRPAEDAILFDSTNLSLPAVVAALAALVAQRKKLMVQAPTRLAIGANLSDQKFWRGLEQLVSTTTLKIDRPRASTHPRYPDMVYPLDYGYLEGTRAGDGAGIDVWVGSLPERRITAVLLTVDLHKRETETKILLGCTPAEAQTVLAFHNDGAQSALLVSHPQP